MNAVPELSEREKERLVEQLMAEMDGLDAERRATERERRRKYWKGLLRASLHLDRRNVRYFWRCLFDWRYA